MRSRTRLVAGLAFAIAIGIAYPYLELAWKCRGGATNSEACTWGRAYFSLSRWVEPFIVAPIAFLLITLTARLVVRRGFDETRR
jgi:hypothetical protein